MNEQLQNNVLSLKALTFPNRTLLKGERFFYQHEEKKGHVIIFAYLFRIVFTNILTFYSYIRINIKKMQSLLNFRKQQNMKLIHEWDEITSKIIKIYNMAIGKSL